MRAKILFLSLSVLLASCKSADGFRMDRVLFHSSSCFGYCPSYHLEVRNDKSMRMHGDSIYGRRPANPDTSKVGYFTAVANDSLFRKLEQQLRTIGLDTLRFDGPDCCDGPIKTIIVYYNGKRKYLRAMFPPDHAQALIAALRDLYSQSAWKPTAETFEIEHDSLPR